MTIDREEELKECLRDVLEETYFVQFQNNVTEDVVKFASKIFHIALEADTEKNYYESKSLP